MVIDSFNTPLGKVDLGITLTPNPDIKKTDNSVILQSKGHRIEVISFDDVKNWMRDTHLVQDTVGWIVRIVKMNDEKEEVSIRCLLHPVDERITSDPASGEHLDALWIEDELHVVSIGTEDGEMMRHRAEKDDWMPTRFSGKLGFQDRTEFSFTYFLDFGFETRVPRLNKGERIYFHYLVAASKKKMSQDYPNEEDISTNFAVDFPKWILMERLDIRDEIL